MVQATTKTLPARKVTTSERRRSPAQLSDSIEPAGSGRLGASSKEPKTRKIFRKKALEQSFVHFLQLSEPAPKTAAELISDCKRWIANPVDFIGSDSFSETDSEASILGDVLMGAGLVSPSGKTKKTPPLPSHLARLCEADLLTPDEEKLLFLRMNYLKFRAEEIRQKLSLEKIDSWSIRQIEGLLKASDWHRDYIVKSNMRLVISIVKKFVNPQNAFDDLLSDGIVAILRAVDKFDVGLGFRFSTYATQVVRRNTYRRVMEKQEERKRDAGSIHENGIDISDDQKESSMTEARWHELRSKLTLMLDHLDRREKLIIRARFSLGGHRRIQTLQKLADRLGVSKERIRQLEKRALDKLRGMAVLSALPEIDP